MARRDWHCVCVVKDTRGEILDDVLGADFPFLAEIWLMSDEVEIDFTEKLTNFWRLRMGKKQLLVAYQLSKRSI